MGLPDKHDPRLFRHFAKLDANGNVVAIIEVADEARNLPDGTVASPEPLDSVDALHVEITGLYPYDLTGVKTTKANVTAKNKGAIRADLSAKNKAPRG